MKFKKNVDEHVNSDNSPPMSRKHSNSLGYTLSRLLFSLCLLQSIATVSALDFRFEETTYNITFVESEEMMAAKLAQPRYKRLGIRLPYDDVIECKFTITSLNPNNRLVKEPTLTVNTVIVNDFAFAEVGTQDRVNRETHEHFQYRMFARLTTHHRGPPYKASANVNLRILDINDLSPLFKFSSYEVNVSSNAGMFTPVVMVSAEDQDLDDNAQVYFGLQDPNFSVDSRSGQVRVIANRLLRDYYEFDVIASNRNFARGRTSKARVKVHVTKYNAYAPVFKITMHNSIGING